MDNESRSTPAVSGTNTPVPPESFESGALAQDAAVWVLISAFIGLSVSWSSGGIAPWLGALIGGGVAFLVATLVIASHG